VTFTPASEYDGHAPFIEFTSSGQHYFPDKPDKIIISEEIYIGRSICSALFCRQPPSV